MADVKSKAPKCRVHRSRVRQLVDGTAEPGGPVIYWMSRDQRVRDNWALLHAQETAARRKVPLAVVFNLVPGFLGATIRQFGFMLKGLEEVEGELKKQGVPFFMLKGSVEDNLPTFVQKTQASAVVMDFSPLRIGKQWREGLASTLKCDLYEVDAHNVVPCWVASDKKEYGARTIRRKINDKLSKYLVEFPAESLGAMIPAHAPWASNVAKTAWPEPSDWGEVEKSLTVDRSVPEVTWCTPGERAARKHLDTFVATKLRNYDTDRNNPTLHGTSDISPWLHFGQISAQRCALEAKKAKNSSNAASVDGFLEELVVRRELADNFCFYNDKYDTFENNYDWAKDTLKLHAADARDKVYTLEQFEAGQTHEELWNAAQLEMVYRGKMHGFMRMYWAKKILEWSKGPEEAMTIAIALNDKYELDGRDPNGYVGCQWAIGGVHDQGWKERPVFGKIRYMNLAGCKRKFKVQQYIQMVHAMGVTLGVPRPSGTSTTAAPSGSTKGTKRPASGMAGRPVPSAKLPAKKKAKPKKKAKALDIF